MQSGSAENFADNFSAWRTEDFADSLSPHWPHATFSVFSVMETGAVLQEHLEFSQTDAVFQEEHHLMRELVVTTTIIE